MAAAIAMSLSLSRSASLLVSPPKEKELRTTEESSPDLDPELMDKYMRLKDAEQNFGDLEVREILIEIAQYFFSRGYLERALSNYFTAYEKAGTTDVKIDITLKVMLIGFKLQDLELLKKQIEQAKKLFEEGGDWERKNRFKAYEGVYLMMIRRFKHAANNFLGILATYNDKELLTFEEFIKYTIITSLVSLDRATIRAKLVSAPEILSVIENMPQLKLFMESLYHCRYRDFFRAFVDIIELVKQDQYLKTHTHNWSREMRVVVYSQFLESYRSVTLDAMATAFGVSPAFLDKELCEFINLGRLACKIDKVNGVVESCRPDSRNGLYQSIIREGDVLLNRLQKLARVMDV